MITRISGTIKPEGGQGLARQNYTVMIPEIAKHFAEVKDCGKYGTINIGGLHPPLRKSFADHWTPRITWHPIVGRDQIGETRHEIFGFIKIKFEYPLGGQAYDAWVILPEGHGASYSENEGVEIISETLIPDVRRGAACAIYIDHKPEAPRPADFGAVIPAVGAQCTPDFFGFNAQDELQYRGRLDASRMTPLPKRARASAPI